MFQTPAPYSSTDHSEQPAAAKRRTFAIISHPAAGKITLTEKLLARWLASGRWPRESKGERRLLA
jgi:translation elongation factor EF-G